MWPGPGKWPPWGDHRNIDVHQLAAQREADVGVLVVGVVQLEAGLGPGLASSALDLRAEDLDDVVVAHDALGVATGVGERVPGEREKEREKEKERKREALKLCVCAR